MAKLSVVMRSVPLNLRDWMETHVQAISGLRCSKKTGGVMATWVLGGVEFWVHQNIVSIFLSEPTKVVPPEIQNLLDLYQDYLDQWAQSEEEIEVTVKFVAQK